MDGIMLSYEQKQLQTLDDKLKQAFASQGPRPRETEEVPPPL